MFFMTLSLAPTSSVPLYFMEPETIFPVGARMFIIEYAVTDLPEPDSPTIPKTFPLSRKNETPLTAFTSPASVKNEVFKSFTSSKDIFRILL